MKTIIVSFISLIFAAGCHKNDNAQQNEQEASPLTAEEREILGPPHPSADFQASAHWNAQSPESWRGSMYFLNLETNELSAIAVFTGLKPNQRYSFALSRRNLCNEQNQEIQPLGEFQAGEDGSLDSPVTTNIAGEASIGASLLDGSYAAITEAGNAKPLGCVAVNSIKALSTH